MQLTEIALLIVGAVVGVLLRYKMVESPLMLGLLQVNVLVVNILGSFVLGLFSRNRALVSIWTRSIRFLLPLGFAVLLLRCPHCLRNE
jgi:CrcB protein